MTTSPRWRRIARILTDYALLTIGALLSATAVRFFLVPNQVVTGGLTGVAQLLNTFIGTPVGVVVLVLNIPLLIAGWRYLGGAVFGVRTFYTVVVMSLAIDGLAPFARPITNDPLLYSLYGGVIDGIGIGLVLRARGTTGGSDILARLIERRFGVQPGRSLLGFDTMVFTAALFSYGPEKILYALLVAFTASRAIDTVLAAGKGARQALIITSSPEPIRQAVLHRLGRGITQLEAIGGYTGATRVVLLCVVARTEIGALKNIVSNVDPAAFVIIGEVEEVLGEGFTPAR
ncbi:YitT family protein [Chloroflexus sp.]|uniref:YitT family protein n=1 Tax=Chloroflexus sp. TaxID=1904827 RepID=UPI0040499110